MLGTVFSFIYFLVVGQITAEGEPDEAVERIGADAVKLYRVSDESGDMSTDEVAPLNGGGLTADLLEVSLGCGPGFGLVLISGSWFDFGLVLVGF